MLQNHSLEDPLKWALGEKIGHQTIEMGSQTGLPFLSVYLNPAKHRTPAAGIRKGIRTFTTKLSSKKEHDHDITSHHGDLWFQKTLQTDMELFGIFFGHIILFFILKKTTKIYLDWLF